MAKKLQILRGTTAQNDAYTGSIGELTMDTEKVEVRIHDGITQGGKTIGSGGANLPILTHVFSDHIINDISWLRADTFSWHSGDVYKAAYEHLAEDVEVISYIVTSLNNTYYRTPSDDVVINGTQYYAWTTEFGGVLLTTSATPQTSDSLYNQDGTVSVVAIVNFVTYIKGAQTETIGDITISYGLADDGHKICLPDQESNLRAVMQATGVAWYYILDTANKRFKLPRTKWGFTGLRDSVGGYVAQDVLLPNITGQFWNGGREAGANGAFYTSAASTSQNRDYSGDQGAKTFNFSASRSSSVYSGNGTNTLIQPRATQMYLYFYVGNFEQDAVEQTAGINTEMFNDLNAHKVIEFQAPTAENGYTWYRKYADGWVEQGGEYAGNAKTITLPIVMATNKYQVAINKQSAPAYWATTNLTVGARTTTSFNVNTYGDDASMNVSWQVSGMSVQ